MGAFYLELSYITRVLWKNHLKKKMEEGGKRSLLIVTTRASAEDVIKNVRAENYDMFNISGLVISDSDMTGRTIGGVKVVANMQNVSKYILKNWVDEVFINQEWNIRMNSLTTSLKWALLFILIFIISKMLQETDMQLKDSVIIRFLHQA